MFNFGFDICTFPSWSVRELFNTSRIHDRQYMSFERVVCNGTPGGCSSLDESQDFKAGVFLHWKLG